MSTSFHTLPSEVRADRRKQAFKLLDRGDTKYEVADFIEVHVKTIENWKRNRCWYEAHNYHGHTRGNPNDQKKLTHAQEENVLRAIKESTPDTEGVASFLWSRKAIREYIQKKYHLTLSPQLISLYTQRWGLSSQRPARCAAEQDSEKVRTWLEETYPEIKRRAKQEGAVIHWADETNININTNYQKTTHRKAELPLRKYPHEKHRTQWCPLSLIRAPFGTWCTVVA